MRRSRVLLALTLVLAACSSETSDYAGQEVGSAGEFVNEYLDCDESVGAFHHTPGSGDEWALNLATELSSMPDFNRHTVGSVVKVGPETWAIFDADDLYIGAVDTTQIRMCNQATDH